MIFVAPGVQRFALADLAPELWRNGGGLTRTVAASHIGNELQWRVSAADITQDGPFSEFPGMDRSAVLLQGEGLVLQGLDQPLRFEQVGAWASFPGEARLQAQLQGRLGARPARLWNVMVRRGRLRAEVQVCREPQQTLAACTCGVLLVVSGRVQVGGGVAAPVSLGLHEGLLLQDLQQPLQVQAMLPGSVWVHTTLQAQR
jgi:uncharacterized protein